MDMMTQMQQKFDNRHYIQGRVALPPWLLEKKARPFVYSGKKTINNGLSDTLTIQIQDDSYFVVEQIQALSGLQTVSMDLATAQITDTTTSQAWSNVAVPLRDLAGLGLNPKYLDNPNILRPTSTVNIQITNNTGSNTTFYFAFVGRKVYGLSEAEMKVLSRRMWYQYVLAVTSLGAGSVNQKHQVQVYNESDFLLKKLLSQQMINAIQGAAAGAESAEIEMQLIDTASDTRLFSDFTAARLLFGALQADQNATPDWGQGAAFCLKKPLFVRRNSIIQGLFNNLAAGASGAFNLTLEGIRIFDAV